MAKYVVCTYLHTTYLAFNTPSQITSVYYEGNLGDNLLFLLFKGGLINQSFSHLKALWVKLGCFSPVKLFICTNLKAFTIWITLKFDDHIKVERICDRLNCDTGRRTNSNPSTTIYFTPHSPNFCMALKLDTFIQMMVACKLLICTSRVSPHFFHLILTIQLCQALFY